MAGFVAPAPAKPSKDNFIKLYIVLCTSGTDTALIGKWLLENAKVMQEQMFDDESNDWTLLEPAQILALRAVSPNRVFTNWAQSQYLARVSGDKERSALASCMFMTTDSEFVRGCPKGYLAQISKLCQLAYRKNIRPADTLVRDM